MGNTKETPLGCCASFPLCVQNDPWNILYNIKPLNTLKMCFYVVFHEHFILKFSPEVWWTSAGRNRQLAKTTGCSSSRLQRFCLVGNYFPVRVVQSSL